MTQESFKLFANEIKAFQEGKQIQVLTRNKWVDTDNPSFDVKSKYRVKPEDPKTTKRLPTIKEIEKWFLENRVFKTGCIYCMRINILHVDYDSPVKRPIFINGGWISVEDFCIHFTHYDGSELYITENEKQKPTYGGEIADFPIEIVERMLECQVEQGNKRDVSVFELKKSAEKVDGGFSWSSTKERGYFWCKVIDYKNFDVFFEKYPKK